jgi:hypothetical protein
MIPSKTLPNLPSKLDQPKEESFNTSRPVEPHSAWNQTFLTRREISKSEDSPYLADVHDDSDDPESDDEGSVVGEPGDAGTSAVEEPIRKFMRASLDSEHTEPCNPQAEILEEVCLGSSLDQLVSNEWRGEPVALLDDGCFDGDTFVRREHENPGPVTAQQLYFRLDGKVGSKRNHIHVKH